MPRLLYMTHHFPPVATSASLRTAGLCRHLSKFGWDVTVVTAGTMLPAPRDLELLAGVPPGVDVAPVPPLRVASWLARLAAREGAIFEESAAPPAQRLQTPRAQRIPSPRSQRIPSPKSRRGSWPRRLLRGGNMVFVPDVLASIVPHVVRCALETARRQKFDAVMAASPPESALLAGARLARALGLPFLVDLHDAWTLGPYARTGKSAWRLRLEERQERAVFAAAARILCASDGTRKSYSGRYPEWRDRFRTLEVGYEEEEFAGIEPIHEGSWNLVHAGTLKSQERRRGLTAVLDGLEKLAPASGVLVDLIGDASVEIRERAAESDRGPEIVIRGALTHRETVARIAGAGGLLLLVDRGDDVVPGKLAEYLRAGRPILAIAPRDGDVARRLEGCAAAEVSDLDDPDRFTQSLARFVAHGRALPRGPLDEVRRLAPRTNEELAAELASQLNAVSGCSPDRASALAPRPSPAVHAAPAPLAAPAVRDAPTPRPALSVIVPTRNRPSELARALASVRRQQGTAMEILVVDDASDDAAAVADSVRRESPGARLLRLAAREGAAEARNRGAAEARGGILVFLDDDAVFSETRVLDRVQEEFEAHPEAGFLTMRIVRERGTILRREFCSRHLWRAGYAGRAPYFCATAFAARRDVFLSLGGFDARLVYLLEEYDLALRAARAGSVIRYVPSIEVLHLPSARGRSERNWLYFQARNRMILTRKNLPAWAALSQVFLWSGYLLCRGAREQGTSSVWRGLRDGVRLARRSRRLPLRTRVVCELGRIGGRTFY